MQALQRYKWIERILIIISILLCCILFFQDRSLLLDSLNVARNIGERSFLDLISPLSYEQSAPLLFLWISKLVTQIFDISHYTLRSLPLIAGVFSLLLFADVSKKIFRTPFYLIALFWFGTHQLVARYATEYKQYMIDVFCTVFIIWIVLKIEEINHRNWWKVAIGGGLIVWLSMPSIFVLISALIYFVIVQSEKKKLRIPLLIATGFIGLSFIANYYVMLSPTIGSDHMQNFHNGFFLEGNIFNFKSLNHDIGLIISQARMLVGKSGLAIGSVLVSSLIAITFSIRQKRYELVLLVLPIVGAFAASLLGKYSILERLMLFSLPLFMMLVVVGIEYVYQKARLKKSYFFKVLFGIIILGMIVGFYKKQSFKYIFNPFEHEDNRSSLVYISKHAENKREIICLQHAVPAYDYYTNHDTNYKSLALGRGIPTNYNADIEALVLEELTRTDKIWVLANHFQDEDIDILISSMNGIATIENSYRAKSTVAMIISKKDTNK